jgi:hypothetical protein
MGLAVAAVYDRRAGKMKTAVRDRRYSSKAEATVLLLGLGDLGLGGGIATLVVSEAAFLFDVLVGLLTHGEMN